MRSKDLSNGSPNSPPQTRIHILSTSQEYFQKHPDRKNLKGCWAELRYASFLKALRNEHRERVLQHKKQPLEHSDPEGSIIDPLILRSVKVPRKVGKVKRLLCRQAYPAIKELRAKGVSWRDISAYLKKKYKIEASHSYITKVVQQVEKETDE